MPRRQCRYEEQDIHLTPREFDLLHCFVRSPGRIYSRTEPLQHVWRGDLPDDSKVIEVHMANLRSKLRRVGAYGFLRTVRGAGYGLKHETCVSAAD